MQEKEAAFRKSESGITFSDFWVLQRILHGVQTLVITCWLHCVWAWIAFACCK